MRDLRHKCRVCLHPERHRAEIMICSGAAVKAVARKIKVPYDSLYRHWRKHVTPAQKRDMVLGKTAAFALADRVADESASVLDHLRFVRSSLYRSFENACDANDRNSVAALSGRIHENLRLTGDITGELTKSPLLQVNNNTVNVLASPEWAGVQLTILRALRAHPEARRDVIAALSQLEQKAPPLLEGKVVDGQRPANYTKAV